MVAPPQIIDEDNGCWHCKPKCKACKLFIKESKTAKSFHSDFIVNIQGKLTCDTLGVIYLINDKTCQRSSVGSTVSNFKTRWSNHKSHIKQNRRTCVISVHFNNGEFHDIPKSPISTFDAHLSNEIEAVIIEKVDFGNSTGDTKLKIFKEREFYWQSQLNTYESFGGLNKRDPRDEIK